MSGRSRVVRRLEHTVARWTGVIGAVLVVSGVLSCAVVDGRGAGATARRAFTDPVTGIELVPVEGGCYWMGASADDCDATPEERPAHEVCVGSFHLGRYEVTRGQWSSVMGSNASASSTCDADACPVVDVSWAEVQVFLGRLNAASDGVRFRLPTEAEWEFAARSRGRDERYSGGQDLDGLSWYSGNSGKANHIVGTKAPNGLGLHDMSGNVWEMTSDWYGDTYYSISPRKDPTGPETGADHVVRGGSRSDGASHQRTTRRTSIGDRTKGAGRGGNVGFRLLTTE